MKKSDIMIYSVLGFIILEAMCFIIASLISPLQAQVTWNSQVTNYPIGTIVSQKETVACDSGKFERKLVYDTTHNNVVNIDIERLDSIKRIKLKPTVKREEVKEFKALEPQSKMWDKATEKEKRKWCYEIVIDKLEGTKYPQKVYEYLFKYAQYAVYEYNHYLNQGIYILASGTLAQAFVEAGVEGRLSSLCSTHNNHFGIKSHGKLWKGKTTKRKDDHYIKGKLVHSSFRCYIDDAASYHDHSLFLINGKFRYRHVLKATTAKDYCYAIGRSGYATSKTYGRDLKYKVDKYNLDIFDVKYNEFYWKTRKDSNIVSW